jgi:nickel/cobalt exporter
LHVLLITAAWLGFFHTLIGPDHYLPFVMISWARGWSALKTAVITFLCGLGHIGSSVVLGLVGVTIGVTSKRLEFFESFRGNLAAWMLMGFGAAYLLWGLWRAWRNKPHAHRHIHVGEGEHTHEHSHLGGHTHVHGRQGAVSIAPWTLFVIFVFGPCEVLIPMLMYPAMEGSGIWAVVLVSVVFGATTIGTMLALVLLGRAGVSFLPVAKLQRYTHAIAGATILLCGLVIEFMGL